MEKFLVEVSARHIHLNREDMDLLFGKDSELHPKKYLSQPGQFASEEKVTLKGPRGEMSVRVLGPLRSKTQVELSLTDARTLGVTALIRESGDLEGTQGGLTLVGPAGEKAIDSGVIAAKRHVHMTPADAQAYGVSNGDIVNVRIQTENRSLVFGDTVIRVSDHFKLAMHIDTDEANAAGISGTAEGEIIKL
jgi:putative phosphotransacetylase